MDFGGVDLSSSGTLVRPEWVRFGGDKEEVPAEIWV
jgi:hypothetical protein